VIGDPTGRLKTWFDTHPVGFVVVRPDRYVAAAAVSQHAPSVTTALATALHLIPGDSDAARPRLDVAQPAAGALAAAG
jgi:3-(3-hydroxy-phenyl)propionate hydroxylase